MNIEKLLQFLIYCGKEGYATLSDDSMRKETDESTSIILERGAWKFHDNYFGGEPYGGREVVFFENKPVWMMVYYGQVNDEVTDLKPVYTFLRKALSHIPDEAPFRGPREFTEGDWKYENNWTGDVTSFSGEEAIYTSETKIYFAKYVGGLVNLK